MSQPQLIHRVSASLPSQPELPTLDSTFGVSFSRGEEFDVLIRVATRNRKGLLHPFVESLGKCCQVFGGVEFGMLQLLWLQVERSVCEWNVWTHF